MLLLVPIEHRIVNSIPCAKSDILIIETACAEEAAHSICAGGG